MVGQYIASVFEFLPPPFPAVLMFLFMISAVGLAFKIIRR
jgi:hypothetical protein